MRQLKLYVFGPPHLEMHDRPLDIRLRKAIALLTYLAVTRRSHTRDTLATLFWPEADQRTGRAALRRTLYNLKRMVGDQVFDITPEFIGIHPQANLWTDVASLQAHIAQSNTESNHGGERRKHLTEAVHLYCGEFMAGFNLPDCPDFDEWQFFQREHYQQIGLQALDALAAAYEEDGRFKEAVFCVRRRLSFDRLNETTHRHLMRLYHHVGEKAAAIRQFKECKRILKAELGATPQPRTVRLFSTIQSNHRSEAPGQDIIRPKTRYTKSGDTYIAYQTIGAGPVDVLLVPGFVSHLEHVWKEPGLSTFLQRLAGFSRLILFDRRGIGLSDRIGQAPTVDHTIEDVHAVMAATNAGQTLLLGISEGGPAGIKYAVRYPQNVIGLILYGTMAKGTRSTRYPFALTRAQYDRWLEHLIRNWGNPSGIEYFAPSRKNDPQLNQWWAMMLRLSSSPGNVRLVLEALRDIDVRALLPDISIPTLILHRKDDTAIRIEAGRYLAEQIPGSKLVELEGEDHWMWIGKVDRLIDNIKNFAASLVDDTPGKIDRLM